MASETFTVGDRVMYREVLEVGDESAVFEVIEDNGDRLTVRFVCDLPIPPTTVVRREELRRVE